MSVYPMRRAKKREEKIKTRWDRRETKEGEFSYSYGNHVKTKGKRTT